MVKVDIGRIEKHALKRLFKDYKFSILKYLIKNPNRTMGDIAKHFSISLPLACYHVNGNNKSLGLIGLNLISISSKSGTQSFYYVNEYGLEVMRRIRE